MTTADKMRALCPTARIESAPSASAAGHTFYRVASAVGILGTGYTAQAAWEEALSTWDQDCD